MLVGRDMITQIKVEFEDHPVHGESVKVADQFFWTNVRGVFVAGDAATPMKVVSQAIGNGSAVAAGIAVQLVNDDHGDSLGGKRRQLT
ncbi:hypothetical protein Asppvi_010643 [Aspergillus pseudoviridinutans]|uniref:FAD/NAD(P)-binding domain-containing protein n=1 Tax=Aspergillus pseudoviridinutans TaxID=1517512 RepID=A0A9P3BQ19_9EURO|nr:uncharacterized protein Asppvi_010643 [Aspergillus pseudoviridinutans]GIJ91671.1 hypothetical protein Asppvi_010643 [Aspergillus pseudoviridinutans]